MITFCLPGTALAINPPRTPDHTFAFSALTVASVVHTPFELTANRFCKGAKAHDISGLGCHALVFAGQFDSIGDLMRVRRVAVPHNQYRLSPVLSGSENLDALPGLRDSETAYYLLRTAISWFPGGHAFCSSSETARYQPRPLPHQPTVGGATRRVCARTGPRPRRTLWLFSVVVFFWRGARGTRWHPKARNSMKTW
jgi:hypothetical protein